MSTRLKKLRPDYAKRLSEIECPNFTTTPWVEGTPLKQRRVAIVSSATLTVRGDRVFRGCDADYRAIPSVTKPNDLLRSHISINVDRNGFQEDWNVVFGSTSWRRKGTSVRSRRRIIRSWARQVRCR